MTTTAVPMTITCPDWCQDTPQHHADELWNLGGVCIHHGITINVDDPTGYIEPLEDLKPWPSLELHVISTTRPDGRETASPVVYLDGLEMSVDQALRLAYALKTAVQTYRAAGGTS